MSVETVAAWPEERRDNREGYNPTQAYFARRREEALDALAKPQMGRKATEAVVAWLREQRDSQTRLPERNDLGQELVSALHQAGFPTEASKLLDASRDEIDSFDINPAAAAVLAQAAMLLLRREPDTRSWRVVSRLRQLGTRLSPALDALFLQALAEPEFRGRYFQMAEGLVAASADAPESNVLEKDKEFFLRLIQTWQEKPTLSDLWLGLRELNHVYYLGHEGEVLGEISRLDPSRFISLLSLFNNPYQVWLAIDCTRASSCFVEWRALVNAAPEAFRTDGSWTGSVVLPLLLVIAGWAVAQGGAPFVRHDTIEAAQEAGRDVSDAAKAVASVLLARADGPAAALRWASWLARSVASTSAEGPPIPTDARDKSFAPFQLLTHVAQRAGSDVWSHIGPADLPIEERWFNLMARVLSVETSLDNTQVYRDLLDSFVTSWPDDKPETWQGSHGVRLRAESATMRTFARQPATLPVRILAIPLTMSTDPVAVITELWRKGAVLREAVEFGELRLSTRSEDEDPRVAAAELCWLTIDLGLCVLDQAADERMNIPYDRGEALRSLITFLWDGIAEMLAIDRFGSETWELARQHLVVRRALFAVDSQEKPWARVIPTGTLPTLAHMLGTMAALDRPFFSALVALLDAGLSVSALQSALREESVDLTKLLDAAERANVIDARRPTISAEEIKRLREVA